MRISDWSSDLCSSDLLGAGRSGWERSLATVRPRIGVVTAVGTDHLKVLHSIEAIAEEKAKLIACLPKDGTAVLNADDARVLAMADRFTGNIITFGRAEGPDRKSGVSGKGV